MIKTLAFIVSLRVVLKFEWTFKMTLRQFSDGRDRLCKKALKAPKFHDLQFFKLNFRSCVIACISWLAVKQLFK